MPAPERGAKTPWKTFLKAHWEALAALITAPRVIERILRHRRLPHTPPPVAPARAPREPELGLWDADPDDSDEAPPEAHRTGRAEPRAPP